MEISLRSSRTIFAFLALGILAAGCVAQPDPASLKPGGLAVGDKAADFALADNNGKTMKLADVQKGWSLVLILFRGHWCSACQNQLINLKEDFPKFTALHAAVAAVSVDTVEESAHFAQEWRFPFPLLSDPKFQVIDAYGARHPEGHEGKDISKPAVILIDADRVVRYKHVGTSPVDRPSDDEILYLIQKMQGKNGPGAPR